MTAGQSSKLRLPKIPFPISRALHPHPFVLLTPLQQRAEVQRKTSVLLLRLKVTV